MMVNSTIDVLQLLSTIIEL